MGRVKTCVVDSISPHGHCENVWWVPYSIFTGRRDPCASCKPFAVVGNENTVTFYEISTLLIVAVTTVRILAMLFSLTNCTLHTGLIVCKIVNSRCIT
jgi:hypothetical protein